ncbi:DEKNAAC105439 [Brettanomyces naardenensis]|uniref:DEKNAAC105439 n=1 Tax=Brettanomyces naardenensis TaxID=13370 RepID=A0A448YTJ6_BRENA|nr:DEKNAAC105439 [Brettanomyces naardenensis]
MSQSLKSYNTRGEFYHENDRGDMILNSGLKAGLKNRMLNLISICGVVGPGIWLGMGRGLAAGGPAGLLVAFAIVGILVLSMMNSIGEMNSTFDQNFALLGCRFVSKGFGATVGIFYCIIWITNIIAEYTSLTSAMEAYSTVVPTYGWYLIFWFVFTLYQMLDVSWWGEAEYILGFTKLIFLAGYYLFAIIYAAGGIKGHSPGNPFKNFPLNDGFKGIANSFVYAGVFYSGVESLSVIASEARNPRKAIPTAVRNTVIRIFYVYFGLSIAYGITVPYNDPTLNNAAGIMSAPMTIAMTNAGWPGSTYLVTTFIWITCFSSINTAIYLAARSLYTTSLEGYTPKIFTKVTKNGIPYVAIHTCHLFGFLSILSYSAGSSVAYSYIVNVTGVACFIVWTAILYIHIRFRHGMKAQGMSVDSLSYKTYLFPWSNYVAIVIGVLLTLVQSWSCFKPFDYKTFIDGYIMLPIFFISWFCYDKFMFHKVGLIKCKEIDLVSGRRPDLDDNVGTELDNEGEVEMVQSEGTEKRITGEKTSSVAKTEEY